MTHFYEDPCEQSYQPPNLIDRLMRYPSRQALTPHENQLTETLAWFLTHSLTFARAFATLVFEGDEPALKALAEAKRLGTRTQLALGLPEGGTVFPDLSLAGDSRSFEILLEVKLDAVPHGFEVEDDWLLQPDMYVRAWDAAPEATQAQVRRVATLTRGYSFPAGGSSATRGRDLTWAQLAELLEGLLDKGALEAPVELLAGDLLEVVKLKVLGVGELPAPEYVEALLADGLALLERIGAQLRAEIAVRGATKVVRRPDYQATYFWLTVPDGIDVQFWLAITPRGGRYNVRGFPDCVSFRIMEGAAELGDARLMAGGFRYREDIAGFRRYQVHWLIPRSAVVSESRKHSPSP